MRKILLASHGRLASGLKNSIEILVGNDYPIVAIDAYLDENNHDYSEDILNFISSVNEEDECVIFTDLYGGSVNQKVVTICSQSKEKIYVITGMNLPILLGVLFHYEKLTKLAIEEIIVEAQVRLLEIDSNFSTTTNSVQDCSDFFSEIKGKEEKL